MSYTDEELSTAVGQIVRQNVRYDYDSLGIRKTGTAFGDLQDAASGLFLSRDGAPFYIVVLARDRLLEASSSLKDDISTLDRYAQAIGRNVAPVTRTRSLINARVALDALATATAQRTGMYQNIETIPAFMRFEKNTGKFLDEEGQKVNSRGSIIETPGQARELVRAALVQLRLSYDELLRKAALLRDSIPTFQALNLPARLSIGIMSNARDVLQGRIDELDEMTPEDRLTVLRETALDIMATRAAVRGFGSLAPPTTFILLEGTGFLFADASHPATPASLVAEKDGGYVVTATQAFMDLEVDSAYNIVAYPLPGSFPAQLDLFGDWYTIPRTSYSGAKDFRVHLDSENFLNDWPIAMAALSRTAWQWMADFNTAIGIGVSLVEAVLRFTTVRTTQVVDVSGTVNITVTGLLGVDFTTFNIAVNDLIYVGDESSGGYRGVWEISAITPLALSATRLTSYGDMNGESGTIITVGDVKTAYPSIRAVEDVSVVSTRTDLWVEDIDEGGCIAHGISHLSRARSQRTTARLVEKNTNISAYTYVGGAPRLVTSSLFVPDPVVGTLSARTHPEDASAISIYLYRGRATVVSTTPFVVELLDDVPEGLASLTQSIIIREGPSTIDIGNFGIVIDVTGLPQLTAVPTVATALSPGDEVVLEVGWNISNLFWLGRKDIELRVEDTFTGQQRYTILNMAKSPVNGQNYPFQFTVDPGVPNFVQPGNQPRFFTATFGRERSVFTSLSTGLDTKVVASSSASNPVHSELFTSDPASAVGTTRWLQLPSIPARLEPGDTIEVHLTSPATPDLVLTVELIEADNNLVKVLEEVPTDYVTSFNFSTSSSIPFTRIRKKVKQNFDDMADQLSIWLDGIENNTLQTFRQLDAAVNSLLISSNPTPVQVNTLRMRLSSMGTVLDQLDTILNVYSAPIVDEVETMLKAFRSQGADRAVDLLLEADFNGFFGVNVNTASYTGNLQQALRSVEVQDFPVRKDNRQGFENEFEDTHIGSYEDVDFEFTPETLGREELVQIPELNDVLPTLPVP